MTFVLESYIIVIVVVTMLVAVASAVAAACYFLWAAVADYRHLLSVFRYIPNGKH